MTVAIRTEIVSALGVERAAQAAVSRLANKASPRRKGPDDKQHQGACPAGSYPDVGRMQGSPLRGATTLAIQRKLPQHSADQVMHGGNQKSPSCKDVVGLPEQGSRGRMAPLRQASTLGGRRSGHRQTETATLWITCVISMRQPAQPVPRQRDRPQPTLAATTRAQDQTATRPAPRPRLPDSSPPSGTPATRSHRNMELPPRSWLGSHCYDDTHIVQVRAQCSDRNFAGSQAVNGDG